MERIWAKEDADANDLLRKLIAQATYKWVYRKLNNARWHLIMTRTAQATAETPQAVSA